MLEQSTDCRKKAYGRRANRAQFYPAQCKNNQQTLPDAGRKKYCKQSGKCEAIDEN